MTVQAHIENARPAVAGVQEDFGLLELLIFFARYKKYIIAFTLAGALLALMVQLARPDVYIATARLLPPQQSQFSSAGLAAELGAMSDSGNLVAGGKTSIELYIGFLKSNRVVDALIGTFDLKKAYGSDSLETVRAQLRKNTVIAAGKDGFVEITVKDANRERVAHLANAYIAKLNGLAHEVAINAASQQRQFFNRELVTAQSKVSAAEQALADDMRMRGVASADDTAGTTADTVASLRAKISEQQVKIDATRSFVTEENQGYKVARQELDSLQRELGLLSGGRGTVAAAQLPGVPISQSARALADARMLYESIATQYELAGMDMAENASTTQVLDAAITPDSRVDPQLVYNVLLAVLAGCIVACSTCFVIEARRRRAIVATAAFDEGSSVPEETLIPRQPPTL